MNLVGQFGSAGGLVLLSGRMLGPQIFLPLVRSSEKGSRKRAIKGKSQPIKLRW
jgi:hypothetical protein